MMSFVGSDGNGSFYGFSPERPIAARSSSAPLRTVVKKMIGWDRRRSVLSTSDEEDWEIGTFVGSDENLVAGKSSRRDTL